MPEHFHTIVKANRITKIIGKQHYHGEGQSVWHFVADGYLSVSFPSTREIVVGDWYVQLLAQTFVVPNDQFLKYFNPVIVVPEKLHAAN